MTTTSNIKVSMLMDNGDEMHFCTTCAFSNACQSKGYDKATLRNLHVLVEHIGPIKQGDYIFREGDDFNAIAAVREGTVKTCTFDAENNEKVLGFFLPGEVIGLNAIHVSKYPCNAIALDDVMLCRFSFPKIALLASKMPGLQSQLFRLLSQDIGKAALLTGDYRADQRTAAFLLTLSRRHAQCGLSATLFYLAMTRTDIANYLRLAPETLSRVFKHFRSDKLIRVLRREIELLDLGALEKLAMPILRY